MPIASATVGADLGDSAFAATSRKLLAYAAVLGMSERRYLDDADEGFVGVPQFCVVPEWPWASDPDNSQRLGLTASEARRALHMGQDSRFHSPIRAGAQLQVSGRLVAVRPTRAGALTVSEIETRNAATGELCVTTLSTALFRDVTVDGEARASIAIAPQVAASADGNVTVGNTAVDIPRELPHLYSECSGIWNPIHTERQVALALGLPDIVLHGTATWAIAGRELARGQCPGDAAQLTRLAGHFKAMVIPGTAIRIEHRVSTAEPCTVRFTVFNADGEPAIADGIAEFAPHGGSH